MTNEVAVWALCFLISAIVMFIIGQIGLGMFAMLLFVVVLLIAGQ